MGFLIHVFWKIKNVEQKNVKNVKNVAKIKKNVFTSMVQSVLQKIATYKNDQRFQVYAET